jgi:hypothetical protein
MQRIDLGASVVGGGRAFTRVVSRVVTRDKREEKGKERGLYRRGSRIYGLGLSMDLRVTAWG